MSGIVERFAIVYTYSTVSFGQLKSITIQVVERMNNFFPLFIQSFVELIKYIHIHISNFDITFFI